MLALTSLVALLRYPFSIYDPTTVPNRFYALLYGSVRRGVVLALVQSRRRHSFPDHVEYCLGYLVAVPGDWNDFGLRDFSTRSSGAKTHALSARRRMHDLPGADDGRLESRLAISRRLDR